MVERRLVRASVLFATALVLLLSLSLATQAAVLEYWTFQTSPSFQKYHAWVKEKFERENPGNTVNMRAFAGGTSGLREKIMAAVAGGTGPDVVESSVAFTREFYDIGLLRDLNDFLDKTPELQPDKYAPFTQIFNQKNGRIHGITYYVDAANITYNVDDFQAAGLDIGYNAMDSWDTLLAYARRLTKRDQNGDIVKSGYHFGGFGMQSFSTYLYANGASFYGPDENLAFNSDAGQQALEFMIQLQDEGMVGPPGEGNPFPNRTSMRYDCTGCGVPGWNRMGLNFRITSFPPGPMGSGRASTGWGNMLVMLKQTQHPDLAWKLIKTMTDLEGQIALMEINQRPGTGLMALYQTDAWQKMVDQVPYAAQLPAIFSVAGPYPFLQYSAVSNAARPLLEKAANGEMSPRDALGEAQRVGNAVLRETAER